MTTLKNSVMLKNVLWSTNLCWRCGFPVSVRLSSKSTRKVKSADEPTPPDVKHTDKKEAKYRSAFITPRATPSEMYINDEELADRLVSQMDLSSDNEFVFVESSPGLGIITRQLLKRGVKNLKLLEGKEVFLDNLKKLQDDNPETIKIACPVNVMDYRKKTKSKLPKDDMEVLEIVEDLRSRQQRLEDAITAHMPTFDWDLSSPTVRFFGVVPERTEMFFMRRVLNSVAKRNVLAKLGRPEFYLILSPRPANMMTTQPGPETNLKQYRWTSVVFQALFDIKLLDEVPRKFLLPPLPKAAKKPDTWYFVRFTARREVALAVQWSDVPELIFFINQAMMSRTKPLVAWIEGWIPGFGRRLLDLGYTLYHKTGDLTASQYVDLFGHITASPEYQASNLKNAYAVSPDGRYLGLHEEDLDEHEDEEPHLAKIGAY